MQLRRDNLLQTQSLVMQIMAREKGGWFILLGWSIRVAIFDVIFLFLSRRSCPFRVLSLDRTDRILAVNFSEKTNKHEKKEGSKPPPSEYD